MKYLLNLGSAFMASLSTVRSTAGTLDVGVGGAAEGASPFATL